jgi:hypothetical protein
MALVKYNNNSISAVTALGSLPAGGLNLITTNTISSGVSSSSFTSNIDSTYDTYMFKYINMHPASDGVRFQVNFRDGGSAFDAVKTSTHFYAFHDEADSTTNLRYDTSHDLAQGTGYQDLNTSGVGNGNDESISGTLFLFSPSSTTFVKHFMDTNNMYFSDNYTINSRTAGYCNVTAAIDGVDFKFDTGNIDSGVIKMYGLSKS